MNTDNFTIESSDIELAQNICKMITDADVRNRAAANAVGANIAGFLKVAKAMMAQGVV